MTRHVNELHARSRIGNSKSAYMTEYNGPSTNDNQQDIYGNNDNNNNNNGFGGTGRGTGVDPVDVLLCKDNNNNNTNDTEKYSIQALGGIFEDPSARTVPNSTEAIVERLLFDTICAFNSGSRETHSIGIINNDGNGNVGGGGKKKKKKSAIKVC